MVGTPNANPVAQLTRYELRHLVAHLEESGRIDDLHRLLALESGERRNAWYEAKDAVGDLQGYLDDVVRAWRLAKQEKEGTYIGKEVLYALCYASVKSLASNIPSELPLMLLQHKIWAEEKIFAYTRQGIYSESRGKALASLFAHLSPEVQTTAWKELLATIREISDQWKQAELLGTIAPHLPEKTLTAARELSYERDRAEVLVAVAPHLPIETLAAAQELSDEFSRAKVLAAVASQLPRAALAAAQKISEEWNQAEVLIAVAETTDLLSLIDRQAVLEEVLTVAREIRDARYRTDVLIAVASSMIPEGQSAIWEEALLATQGMHGWSSGDRWSEHELIERRTAIALHLPEEKKQLS